MDRDLVRVAVEAADVLDERFREQIDRILETQREFSNRLIAIERIAQEEPAALELLKRRVEQVEETYAGHSRWHQALIDGKATPGAVEWICPKCGGKVWADSSQASLRCFACGTPKPDSLEAIREATGGAWDGSEPAKVEGTAVKPDPLAKPAWWDESLIGDIRWGQGDTRPCRWVDMSDAKRELWVALADAIIDAELITRDELVAEERRKALNEAADAVIDWSRQGYVNTGTFEKIADNIRRRAEGADE